VRDDRLRLIFTCCPPALAAGVQVALTLRLLGGLTTAEIARAFVNPRQLRTWGSWLACRASPFGRTLCGLSTLVDATWYAVASVATVADVLAPGRTSPHQVTEVAPAASGRPGRRAKVGTVVLRVAPRVTQQHG
jgi:hypothetical protein